jgi:hypothetical protein
MAGPPCPPCLAPPSAQQAGGGNTRQHSQESSGIQYLRSPRFRAVPPSASPGSCTVIGSMPSSSGLGLRLRARACEASSAAPAALAASSGICHWLDGGTCTGSKTKRVTVTVSAVRVRLAEPAHCVAARATPRLAVDRWRHAPAPGNELGAAPRLSSSPRPSSPSSSSLTVGASAFSQASHASASSA